MGSFSPGAEAYIFSSLCHSICRFEIPLDCLVKLSFYVGSMYVIMYQALSLGTDLLCSKVLGNVHAVKAEALVFTKGIQGKQFEA
jgi:hypothetical protein